MPTKIYFRGGANVVIKGETEKEALKKNFFRTKARAVALVGHNVEFRLRDVLCKQYQPEKEYQENLKEQEKKAQEAAAASLCRRCGTKSPAKYDHCPRCGSQLVKKQPPMLTIPGQNKN